VARAYRLVEANAGAAGVDKESIERFAKDLKNNLYKIWNRMSSGSYFPPPVRAVPIPKRMADNAFLACRQSAHSAQSSYINSDSIVVTHPFHPLTKRRLRILFERRRAGGRVYICECGERTVTLAEDWTNRGEPPAPRPLTYERLADLHKALSAIKGG
jgi:Family of unknown function (DUF5372)